MAKAVSVEASRSSSATLSLSQRATRTRSVDARLPPSGTSPAALATTSPSVSERPAEMAESVRQKIASMRMPRRSPRESTARNTGFMSSAPAPPFPAGGAAAADGSPAISAALPGRAQGRLPRLCRAAHR